MAGGPNFFGNGPDTSFLDYRANLFLNANFDFFQRGATINIAGGAVGYVADQWFLNNKATGGNWRAFQTTNATILQTNALELISTANGTVAGPELYQVLENADTMQYFNTQIASVAVKVGAIGNINQVGLQFCYATTEVKPTALFIGNEVTFGVTSSTFLLGAINGQALGTSFAIAGVLGVRIRPTGVISGNISDSGNGIQVTQPYLTRTPYAITAEFNRRYQHTGTELQACQRFYEKSYDLNTAPGTSTGLGNITVPVGITILNGSVPFSLNWKVSKRVAPSIVCYSIAGLSGQLAGIAASAVNTGQNGSNMQVGGNMNPGTYSYQFTAEAGI